MGQIVFGVVMALITLFGLSLASMASDFGFKFFAWALVAFGIIMIFALINNLTKPENLKKH
jgi:hypothetical protein